jgi:hypothetical protein
MNASNLLKCDTSGELGSGRRLPGLQDTTPMKTERLSDYASPVKGRVSEMSPKIGINSRINGSKSTIPESVRS